LPHGCSEVTFNNVFVPKENLLGPLGGAFKMA
jgi:acyl-CoA dehydrogenase family protein 10